MTEITDAEFAQFQRFIYEKAGIRLTSAKKALVMGRLSKRLAQCGARSYAEYFRLLTRGGSSTEAQTAVDLLTTNETYFFREPKHFEFLKRQLSLMGARSQPFRAWSAASSSGEEAYSIAMLLEDRLAGQPYEVIGSDISSRVLQRARAGHYSLERTSNMPAGYLQRFCLKGVGEQEGTLLISRELRSKVQFLQVNLNASLPGIGTFDVVFLRNVLIYFDVETKRRVVERVLGALKPGGWFFIGHSETLNDICTSVRSVAPAIYQKS